MAHIGETPISNNLGNTEGRELVVDTTLARAARKLEFRPEQWDLIVGSLLGDGALVKTTRGYAFRVNHGIHQKDYVDWKYDKLKDFVNSSPRFAENCYYFRTVTHDAFNVLQAQFYPKGKKEVPKELIESRMNATILAVWIMDDGSKDSNQIRINSQSFSEEDNRFLANVLRTKLGIETRINHDKEFFRLRVAQSSMRRLIELVRRHIVPSMFYKFSL